MTAYDEKKTEQAVRDLTQTLNRAPTSEELAVYLAGWEDGYWAAVKELKGAKACGEREKRQEAKFKDGERAWR